MTAADTVGVEEAAAYLNVLDEDVTLLVDFLSAPKQRLWYRRMYRTKGEPVVELSLLVPSLITRWLSGRMFR